MYLCMCVCAYKCVCVYVCVYSIHVLYMCTVASGDFFFKPGMLSDKILGHTQRGKHRDRCRFKSMHISYTLFVN